MRAALDATPLAASGGLRRYTAELARALVAEFPEDEFLLVPDERGGPRNWLERRWWSWGLNRVLARERCDLFHGTNFEVPYVPLRPSVMTVHDLSPWSQWQDAASRVRRRTPLLVGLGLATLIITPTEAIRREVIARFRVAPQRVFAVPEAAAAVFKPGPLGSDPYFLALGGSQPRKNLATVAEAARAIGAELRQVDGEASDEELAALYSGALAFLYPSLYEGFGLPVIEAMQCGAPVIASRDPAVAEVAGGAAVLVEARDGRGWAEAMRAALERPEWRSQWRARSLARAGEFSWARTARRTREIYDEARRRFST